MTEYLCYENENCRMIDYMDERCILPSLIDIYIMNTTLEI